LQRKTSSTKYFEVFLQQGRRQGRAGARPAYFSEHARQAGGAIFGKPDGLGRACSGFGVDGNDVKLKAKIIR